MQLEDTARYEGFLLAPLEGFGLQIFMLFLSTLGFFWFLLVTTVTFDSHPSYFEEEKNKTFLNKSIFIFISIQKIK